MFIIYKDGAALIYVTTNNPNTYDILDSYLLSILFNEKNSTLSKSLLKGFEFNISAQYIDKSSVFIPSGWDSKSRISLLNSEFDGIINRSDYEKLTYSNEFEVVSNRFIFIFIFIFLLFNIILVK